MFTELPPSTSDETKIAVRVMDALEIPYRERAEPYTAIIEAIEEDGAEDFYFEYDGMEFRCILDNFIDGIQQEELKSDLYMLGCFNSSFLWEITGIDEDVIIEMQRAEAYEAIGKLILFLGKLGVLQKTYKGYDGYGHHFAHYDGKEIETEYFITSFSSREFYHIFRVN